MNRFPLHLFTLGLPLLLLLNWATPALAQDYTGWWWIPSESGTGYSLQVQELPDKDYDLAYLVWYLYDETGANTWLSSIMQVWGDSMGGPLMRYDGWPLESGLVSYVVPTQIGTISIIFRDENKGDLYYDIGDIAGFTSFAGHKHLTRWENSGIWDPRELRGWWWDESKPGMGWFMAARNYQLFLGWFNYREPLARTGGEPRWYIAVDRAFSTAHPLFSEPLLDYSGGQTYDGPYQAPSYVEANPEENFEFYLPGNSTPESLDVEYQGQAYHLTRFTIPDAFPPDYAGCAPLPISLSPEPDSEIDLLKPWVQAVLQTPCGSAIDDDSIVMEVSGEVVPHEDYDETPDRADLRYKIPEQIPLNIPTVVSVSARDENGIPISVNWSFSPQYIEDY